MDPRPDPQSAFDAKAATWDDDPVKLARARDVGAAIRAAVPDLARRSVLEYGAGTGLLGLVLQPDAAQVTLADSSREMLAMADRKIGAGRLANVVTRFVDLAAGGRLEGPYDLICSLMVLHHVMDVPGLLRSFHGLLAPGGVLCLSDLDAEDGSFHGPGFTGHDGFERGVLTNQLAQAGFAGIRFSTVHQMVKDGRSYPVFLAVAGRR